MTAPDHRAAALDVSHLSHRWPSGVTALDDVSLRVAPGEFVAVLGPSGAGKSTLLRCISRLVEPSAGRVHVGPVDVTAARGAALCRARSRIGFVFQQFNLIRAYTVLENVLAARMPHVAAWRAWAGMFEPADVDRAMKALADVDLDARAASRADELSGGQQQRVAIARAFAQDPAILLADEPTASLDPGLADVVLSLLRNWSTRNGRPVIVNVHTVEHARKFADRVVALRAGRLVHDGPVSSLDDGRAAAIYAGSA